MHIEMRFDIGCNADVAWDALHDPLVVSDLYAPALQMGSSVSLPTRWNDKDVTSAEVRLLLFGRIPVGRQVIDIRDEIHGEGVSLMRTMHDHGRATAGPLTLLRGWHHRMSVWTVDGDPARTRWLDRVEFHGPVAVFAWPVMRVIWGLRERRIRRLAPQWQLERPTD